MGNEGAQEIAKSWKRWTGEMKPSRGALEREKRTGERASEQKDKEVEAGEPEPSPGAGSG